MEKVAAPTKGIVINAGGSAYLRNAWVATRALRSICGCTLPVEWWVKDCSEQPRYMAECAERVGATIRLASEACPSSGRLHPWARKVFSVVHSAFQEVMLLDADIVTVRDPAYLFDCSEYQEHGALFWPDIRYIPRSSPLWEAFNIPFDPAPSFQGGQQIIDKGRCSRGVKLTMCINEADDVWYNAKAGLFFGEQDTWRFAFKATGTGYNMIARPALCSRGVITEFGPRGERLFQHRCGDKWKADGSNREIPHFWYEESCRYFLSELRELIQRYEVRPQSKPVPTEVCPTSQPQTPRRAAAGHPACP